MQPYPAEVGTDYTITSVSAGVLRIAGDEVTKAIKINIIDDSVSILLLFMFIMWMFV